MAHIVLSWQAMDFEPSARSKDYVERVRHFMRTQIQPVETTYWDGVLARTAFGKPLLNLGGNRERVAEGRIAIDQARLLTLYAAWKMGEVGALGAMTEIAAIKVVAPTMLQRIVDEAIQMHGGAGLTRDTPLAGLFAQARALRLGDGPDEVHKGLIARIELAKRGYAKQGQRQGQWQWED